MNKSITCSIALFLLCTMLTSCASSGNSNKRKGTTMYHLIKNRDYSAATDRLNTLYAAYPSSAKAEKQFLSELRSAVFNLPKKHQPELDGFLKLNSDGVAQRFMSALYFHETGVKARGTKFVPDTETKKLNSLRDNLVNSIARFQSVLKDDPNSYLAHTYNGINYSYLGTDAAELAEFRSAVELKPTSALTWNSFINHSQPRWGGSHEIMQELIDEMTTHEDKNPELRALRGLALSDKANLFIRQNDFANAEEQLFQALEFGSNYAYGRNVDLLMRKVKESGDETGACRIIKKTHAIYPDNKKYRELAQDCG